MSGIPRSGSLPRIVLGVAALVLLAGCFKTFPRRVPGSDMTLPPPTGIWALEALLDCATPVETKGTAGKATAGARDVATCRTATGDTVPDHRRPTPPPTPVP